MFSLTMNSLFYLKLFYLWIWISSFILSWNQHISHFFKDLKENKDRQHLCTGSIKNPIPFELRSCVVYKFGCAGCNVCYVGETSRDFSTRVREKFSSDKASHIFKHLQNSNIVAPYILLKDLKRRKIGNLKVCTYIHTYILYYLSPWGLFEDNMVHYSTIKY